MAQDTAPATVPDCEVMASVDGDTLVIAELCRDEAWISMPLDRTAAVAEWV